MTWSKGGRIRRKGKKRRETWSLEIHAVANLASVTSMVSDGMSASASEVLARSLHDNCPAVTIMGDNSFRSSKGFLIQAV